MGITADTSLFAVLLGGQYDLKVSMFHGEAGTDVAEHSSNRAELSWAAVTNDGPHVASSASFAQLRTTSQRRLCISPTFGDGFSELICVQTGGSHFIAAYRLDEAGTGLTMPWGWGVNEATLKAVVSCA